MRAVRDTDVSDLPPERVSIEDDRAAAEPSIEERLERLEHQGKIVLDQLLVAHEVGSAVPGIRRRHSQFEATVLDMLARQNNALTILLARSSTERSRDLAGRVVLIVEDEEHVLNTFQQMLAFAGATVFYERTAVQGRMRLEKVGPDVVDCALLDVRLPDSEGTQLAHDIWRRAPGCGVVLTSGYPLDDFEEAAERHHFALLEKPFEQRALIDAVLAAIQLRGTR